jgi:hypothetical protein
MQRRGDTARAVGADLEALQASGLIQRVDWAGSEPWSIGSVIAIREQRGAVEEALKGIDGIIPESIWADGPELALVPA